MEEKEFKNNLNIKTKRLKVVLTLLTVLACSNVFAEDKSYTPVLTANSTTIQLDRSKVTHPILDILNSNLQSPSEYNRQHKKVPIVETKPPKTEEELDPLTNIPDDKINKENEKTKLPTFDEIPTSSGYTNPTNTNILPQNYEGGAFAPPQENITTDNLPPSNLPPSDLHPNNLPPLRKEAVIGDTTPPQDLPSEDLPQHLHDNFPQEDSYAASIQETLPQEVQEDIDFNGKTIKNIYFNGINLVSENVIFSQIKTRSGEKFSSEILQEDLQQIYSTGYFTENMSIEPELNQDGSVSLTFNLEENPPVTEVFLTGNTVFSQTELMPFVKSLKGLPQNLNLINDSIEKINNYYHEKGYILANVSSVDDNSAGELTFGISEGVIEKIVYEGNKKTKDYVIERNVLTQAGSIYNEEYIKKDLAKVYSTQIFDEVDRKIDPSPDKEGEYIVTITVKEGSSNSLSIGGGLDSALGIFGSVAANEKNFLGRGQKVSLTGMVGSGLLMSDASIKNRMNFNVELNFFEPYLINADNSLASKIYYRDLGSYQIPLAIERRFGANAEVRHKVKGSNNITTMFGGGFEHISLKEGDYDKISKLYKENNINIAKRDEQLTGGLFFNLNAGAKYSTLDDEFMPRDGLIAQARYTEALCANDFKRTNGRLAGAITKYFPVFKKSSLSIGAKAGIKVHGDHMPEVMAFRLGGPYTVRGFKMNGVGTGESFLMGSAELLTPIPLMDKLKYDFFKNLRFAFFVDAGRVYRPTLTSTLYDRPLSAITAGIGLRVNIPGMGPISVDYGLPLTNPGHYGSKRGYFTFGTGGLYDNY